MIDPKELRKGNILKSLSLEIYCPVQTIEVSSIALKCDTGRVRCDYVDHKFTSIDPIPLTAEWLERMGFQTETIPDVVDNEGDIIKGYTHWTNGKFCFHFSNGKVEGREHIKYVHLLQNWYYFNTFEELKIKMP